MKYSVYKLWSGNYFFSLSLVFLIVFTFSHSMCVFSLKCTYICPFNELFTEKPRPQCLQINGFSPVCTRICRSKWEDQLNTFPHCRQVKFSDTTVLEFSFGLELHKGLLSPRTKPGKHDKI